MFLQELGLSYRMSRLILPYSVIYATLAYLEQSLHVVVVELVNIEPHALSGLSPTIPDYTGAERAEGEEEGALGS